MSDAYPNAAGAAPEAPDQGRDQGRERDPSRHLGRDLDRDQTPDTAPDRAPGAYTGPDATGPYEAGLDDTGTGDSGPDDTGPGDVDTGGDVDPYEAAGPAPLGVVRTPTGRPAVDALLDRLGDADHLTADGHLDVYEDVHRGLRAELTSLDAPQGPAPRPYDNRS